MRVFQAWSVSRLTLKRGIAENITVMVNTTRLQIQKGGLTAFRFDKGDDSYTECDKTYLRRMTSAFGLLEREQRTYQKTTQDVMGWDYNKTVNQSLGDKVPRPLPLSIV